MDKKYEHLEDTHYGYSKFYDYMNDRKKIKKEISDRALKRDINEVDNFFKNNKSFEEILKEAEEKHKQKEEEFLNKLLKGKFRMVEKLEIKTYSNGTGNLNFWDYMHGNDVIAEIDEDGNLFLVEYDEDMNKSTRPITFPEFIVLVQKSIQSRSK